MDFILTLTLMHVYLGLGMKLTSFERGQGSTRQNKPPDSKHHCAPILSGRIKFLKSSKKGQPFFQPSITGTSMNYDRQRQAGETRVPPSFKSVVLKLYCTWQSPWSMWKQAPSFWSVGLEWGPRMCISTKWQENIDAAGPGTTLWEPLFQMIKSAEGHTSCLLRSAPSLPSTNP